MGGRGGRSWRNRAAGRGRPARLRGCGVRWKTAGSGRDARLGRTGRGGRGCGFANAGGAVAAGGRDARPGGFRGSRVSFGSQGAGSRVRGLGGVVTCHYGPSSLRYRGVCPRNIKGADKISATLRAVPWLAGKSGLEKGFAHCPGIGWPPLLNLGAHQERGDPGDNRSGKAAASQERRAAARGCAPDILARRENPVRPIGLPPVTCPEGFPVRAQRADAKHRWDGSGNVYAGAAVIPDSCNNKHIVVLAQPQRPPQHALRLPFWRLLPPADVDDVGSLLHGLLDGPSEIELGEVAFVKVLEDGRD